MLIKRLLVKGVVMISVLQLLACAHAPVGWERAGVAARHAALHPSVWAPLAGASVFAVEDLDNQVANHLSDHAPVFGDKDSADDTSDQLKSFTIIAAGLSAFLVPDPGNEGMSHHLEHLAVALGGVEITRSATQRIKDVTDRQRPNKENDESSPSGHASQAFAAATFASRNFHRAWGDSAAATWADAGVYTAASLTAYARVEAEKHHPSDVLIGAALGNFVARFMDELLLEDNTPLSFNSYINGETAVVGVRYGF